MKGCLKFFMFPSGIIFIKADAFVLPDSVLIIVVIWLMCGCGPAGQPAGAVRPTADIGDAGVRADDNADEPVAIEVPNEPFAMLGGGPRHLNRSNIEGPLAEPVVSSIFRTGARVFSSPVIGPDGTIYIGSIDGTFNAMHRDGKLRWSYVCGQPVFATAAISQSGVVYTGCDDETLIAFTTDGAIRWTYRMSQDVDSAPVIADNEIIYVGGDGLHAITSAGKRKWKLLVNGHINATPSVRPDGMILVGSHDNRMYAVKPNGTVAWTFGTKGVIQGSAAILNNNDAVFGSGDGFVYRLSPGGGLRWKFKTGGPVLGGVAVSSDESILYMGSMSGSVFALEAKTGKKIWKFSTGAPVRSTPTIDSAGRLYIGSRDHHLYALSASTGETLWRIDLGAEIDSTAAVASGERLIVGCDDGAVRILSGRKTQ